MDEKFSKHLEGIDQARRDVIKRLVMGTAFAIPLAVSFGIGSANATGRGISCFVTNLTPGPQNPNCGFVYTPNTYLPQ